MAIDPHHLLGLPIPDVRQGFSERDTILYALALGYGQDPTDERALVYCYEKALKATPTLPLVLAHPGFWMRDLPTGIDWRKVVHAEQTLEVHGPIPTSGEVTGQTRVVEVLDRGEGKGAMVIFERRLLETATGRLIATMRQSNLCRADGGFGGVNRKIAPPAVIPDRQPECVVWFQTRPEMALCYRLSADPNPLHADPEAARLAGFSKPILHGLATFGAIARAIIMAESGYRADRLKRLQARFTGVVYPGETIQTELWRVAHGVNFRARVLERETIVIDNGVAHLD
jgi:acyl dehydratase